MDVLVEMRVFPIEINGHPHKDMNTNVSTWWGAGLFCCKFPIGASVSSLNPARLTLEFNYGVLMAQQVFILYLSRCLVDLHSTAAMN